MGGPGGRRGTRRVLGTALLGALALVCGAPAAEAQIVVGDARASEAAGSLTFTITRAAPAFAPAVTVKYATAAGSARSPADFTATSGSRTFPGTLLFGATQTHAVTVALADDALDEADESFRLRVSGAGVSDGEGVGTIADDDPPPVVSVADAPAAVEGGVARFAIRLSARSGRTVTVAFGTVDGSAVAAQDYAARAGTVAIAPGATSAAVAVPLIDDSADEPDEQFELRIGAPAAATLGDATAVGTVADNDDAAPAALPAPSSTAPAPTGGRQNPAASGGSSTGAALPRLGVSRPRLRRPATVLVTISCPREAGRCHGRVTIFSRPNRRSRIRALRAERRLGRRTFALAAGAARTLQLALSRRDRALLRRAGRMKVRAYVVAEDAAGRTGVRRVNGTLVARTTHSD